MTARAGAAAEAAAAATSTVADPPAWERAVRERPTWGLQEGDAIAPGRTVLQRLGGGHRCEVLLVWDDHRLAVLVAKVLRPDQAGEPGALRELAREADILARLGHPVIVRGFDAVLDGRFPHLLTEHLEGPTLGSLLDGDGPLALEQLLPLGLHAASALHYLAAEGLVHLDVKPANLVMGVPPRLIDFGVARPAKDAARLRRPVGTDGYMAPEQCGAGWAHFDGPPVGPAADVFGLGATLRHALTADCPFPRPAGARRALDRTVRFPQLVRGPEPLPRRVPRPLAELLDAAVARDPAERPSAAALAAGLEPLVAGLRA